MEMGLAFIAFIITIPWASVAKGIRVTFSYCLRALSRQPGSRNAKQDSQTSSAQSKKDSLRFLTDALEGFQKAQCWFMLATNIASIVVLKNGGLDPSSLQELYNTYVFIKVVAIGGYLPITFTLLNLHMINKISWYPIGLSTATVALAITTLSLSHKSFTPTVEDFGSITSAASQGGPNSCASQNLAAYCYSRRKEGKYFGFNASSSGSGANNILAFCLVTLAIIIIDHFCRSKDRQQTNLNRLILKKLHIDPSKPLFPHAGTVLRVGTPVFYFVFFGLYVYCFYLFIEDLIWFGEKNVYHPTWGFGQVIAVLVWMPTLFDYAWVQTRSCSLSLLFYKALPKRSSSPLYFMCPHIS